MRQNVDPAYWPEHLQAVFRQVGKAMGGKHLHPDVLQRLPHDYDAILTGHSVSFEHRSGEGGKPKGNHYAISICGPRFSGTWTFWSGELEQSARSASAATD